jgi:hypothetical protein
MHLETASPPRITFFMWIVALGKILIANNFQRQNIILVNWCCMCKVDGKTIDHLFLHYYTVAKEMWDIVLTLFGMHWVMPRHLVDLLDFWQGKLGRHRHIEIWKAIPHCLMWCIWRERNTRSLELLRIAKGMFWL